MRITRTLGIMLLALSSTGIAFAQAGGGGGPGGGGFGGGQGGGFGGGPGGGGPGNFDPAQMQQQMMDNIKQQLGVSDQDFAAIQPALQAVMQAQREAGNGNRNGRGGRGGGGPGGGGFGGQGGPGGQQTQATTPVQKALADLQVLLDNSSSTPDQIHAKVQVVRDAKTAAHDKLLKAEEELRTLLTQRQEATLTVMGYLE